MNVAKTATVPSARAIAPFFPMLAAQTKSEFLMLARVPAFTIPTIVFPIMFFALFGLPNVHEGFEGTTVGKYMLASFGAYAVISVALFSFGVTVAAERARKMTALMRSSPLRPLAYLGGKTFATLAFALVTLVALFAFGAFVGGIRLEAGQWFALVGVLLLGVFPFIALGFAVGYIAGGNSAVAILNLINLPMAFGSGLFLPLPMLPHLVQQIAPYLPAYHYGQLAWSVVGAGSETPLTAVLWLAGYSVAFLLFALRAYGREQTKEFG
jgi:ABC-2 type transport system permease protein